MQNKYFIVLVNNKISISRCENGEFFPLKIEGEEEQNYSKNFWEWFKDKIEYDDEALSFVVISDKNDFVIAPDIVLNKINTFENDTLCKKKIETLTYRYSLLSFPAMQSISSIQEEKDLETPKETICEKTVKRSTKKTIADIFNRQTQEYENEKR